MESYSWLLILAAWSLLLLLGLAGGDPMGAGRPGHAASPVAFSRWLSRTPAAQRPERLRRRTPAAGARATESGLHAVA